jgi:hypothetical protein
MLDLRALLLLRIWMLLKEPLDFAQNFIKSVNDAIKMETPGKALSRIQCYWLSFCISAVILTNSVCWIRFEKISLGRFQSSSLSWMFKRGNMLGAFTGFQRAGIVAEVWHTSRHVGFR